MYPHPGPRPRRLHYHGQEEPDERPQARRLQPLPRVGTDQVVTVGSLPHCRRSEIRTSFVLWRGEGGWTDRWFLAGMRIRIRSDPVIFGPPDPDPVLFSMDPDPDPTCNNGFIKLFSS